MNDDPNVNYAYGSASVDAAVKRDLYRIEIFPRRTLLRGRQWYFRFRSNFNGKVVGPSEGYKNLKDCEDMAISLRQHLRTSDIVRVEK